jgi:hypothetical protein
MKRIFITHIVPKDHIETLNVSAAANYFSYNLIDNNCFDIVYSLMPTNIELEVVDSSKVQYIQSNYFSKNRLSKFFNMLLNNIKLFKIIKKESNIWYYNLTHQTLLTFILIRFLRPSVKQYIIVLDFTPSDKKWSLQNFILNQINKADGLLSLTINKQLSQKNTIVIPGIVPIDLSIKKQFKINKKFILSGILSKNRCPELILKTFSKFPQYELIITGVIEDHILIDKYVNKYSNINYLGFLEYSEYLKVLEASTFSINSRDPSYKENDFNFPSKTVEHLKHNKIVISTMKYSELKDIKYFYVKPNISDFSKFLSELEKIDDNELLQLYANQSNVVTKLFGIDKWKKTFSLLENN